MSDEQQTFGKESIEQSQNYSPMPMAIPDEPPREDYKDLNGEPLNAEDAGKYLAERRAETERATQEPVERRYNYAGGEHAGEKMPDSNVVELDRASRDLAGIREAEQAAEKTGLDLELQQAIDQLRSGQPEPQQPQQAYQQQQEQPQPAAEQPRFARGWEDPEVISTVSEWTQQREAQYVSSLAQNAQTALAASVSQFPELRSITNLNQIEPVINAVAQSNPQRAQAMAESVRLTAQTLQQWQTANVEQQQQQAAQYQQRWSTFAKEQDAKFTEKYPDISDKVRTGAVEYLRNVGFSDDDLSKSWNGEFSWSPRDARVQEIIRDASLYRQAQKAAKTRMANPVPTVMRPGSPVERPTDRQYALADLNAKLNQSGSPKDAARLLIARRAGR